MKGRNELSRKTFANLSSRFFTIFFRLFSQKRDISNVAEIGNFKAPLP